MKKCIQNTLMLKTSGNTMAVYLYIVRHGEAEPISQDDESRALTEHGLWEAKRTALWLKTQVNEFTHTFVSPYKRAQQTKDTILLYGPSSKTQSTEGLLTPEGSANTAMDFLLASVTDNQETDQHILCVSHMPLVSYLIGELTGYTPIMATAGVAQIKVDIEKWQGQLKTLLSPEQML